MLGSTGVDNRKIRPSVLQGCGLSTLIRAALQYGQLLIDTYYNKSTEMGRTHGEDDKGRVYLLPAYWRLERLPLAKFIT
jgi:hypothetical protein